MTRLKDVRDKRVLIVDTNAMMRRLLRDMLGNFRVKAENIIEAATLEAALEAVNGRPFDMIITEFNLGDIDAGDFARHVRGDKTCPNRKTPILLTTTAPSQDRVLKALEAGINEVLAKPIAPSALLFRMVSIWSRPRPFVIAKDYIGPSRSAQRLEALARLSRSNHIRREWRAVYRGDVKIPASSRQSVRPDPFLH